eukprot:c10644_g1_i3.p1 GENE.c10644_g1_i3~~c10644_g1_i3.p1  ORF type:complete len:415 (+),score=69.96 c10644_g1_i3:61-1245(+)
MSHVGVSRGLEDPLLDAELDNDQDPRLSQDHGDSPTRGKTKAHLSVRFTPTFQVPPERITPSAIQDTSGVTHIRRVSLQQVRDPISSRPVSQKIRYYVESLPCRLFIVFLVLFDLGLLIHSFVDGETALAKALTWVILICYVIELIARVFVVPNFFRSWFDTIDALVVFSSVLLRALEYSVGAHVVALIRIIRVVRIVRTVRIATVLNAESRHISRAARRHISQNKRRFFYGAFELDMTYITDRMIAMSVPATGFEALYRNPIGHVAGYFNTKHAHHYRIYNLCAERTYDETKFENRVVRYPVDDHNVMPLATLVAFCQDVQRYLDSDESNVATVHCRGGKGRTGLCVCAWLLHSKTIDNAQEALNMFASRRTDESLSRRFQGVQTPSQFRTQT